MSSLLAAAAEQADLDGTWSAATTPVAEGYADAPAQVDASAVALIAAVLSGSPTRDAEEAHLLAVLGLLLVLALAVRDVVGDAMDEAARRSAYWAVVQLDALGVPVPAEVAAATAAGDGSGWPRRYTQEQLAALLIQDADALRTALHDTVAHLDSSNHAAVQDAVTGWTDQTIADAATRAVLVVGEAVTGTWERTAEAAAAHADGVLGWVWTPSPAGCCGVCGMLAGTFHPPGEPMRSHPHCRCVRRWVTARGDEEASIPQQWKDPGRDTVRAAFGPAAELAWRDGRVTLDDNPDSGLLTRRPWVASDGETGEAWARRALRDIVGIDDAAYYIGQVRADRRAR